MRLTQAILPVAGLGTRFLPWTKVVPKELLPIGNQPMIALLVDECLSSGITDICFVISHGKELIPQYFEADPMLETELRKRGKIDLLAELQKYDAVNFHTVYQEEQLGDGHAILQAANWVKSEIVAILFGDDLIVAEESGLQQLVSTYGQINRSGEPTPALLCLENVLQELVSRYGIVDVDPDRSRGRLKRIRGLVEKPPPGKAPSLLAIVGKYLIPKSTFAVLKTAKNGRDGEIRLIDALTAQMPETPIYGYEVKGKRLDVGTPEGYREAIHTLI